MKDYQHKYYTENRDKLVKQVVQNKKLRYQKNKLKAVEMLGGKCQKCGYKKCIAALEFHHPDGSKKEKNIADILDTWSKVIIELKKCQLLCANCHREVNN